MGAGVNAWLAPLTAVAIATAVLAIFEGVRRMLQRPGVIEQRLAEFAARVAESDRPVPPIAVARQPSPLAQRLNEAISNRDFAAKMAIGLAKANVRLTVSEFVMIRVAVICVAFLVGVLISRHLLPGVMLAAVGAILPGQWLAWRQRKRQHDFEGQLSDVLTLLVGSVRAGYSLLHALEVVSREIPPPASEELHRVVREVGFGLPMQEALENLVRRMESDDLSLIVTAINIQHEVGGNLANVLDTISQTIRERVRIQREIRVMTTQQRATGYLLTLLPFILGGILFLVNPSYMMRLFTPGPILIIPVGAVTGMALGFVIMRKILSIEV